MCVEPPRVEFSWDRKLVSNFLPFLASVGGGSSPREFDRGERVLCCCWLASGATGAELDGGGGILAGGSAVW